MPILPSNEANRRGNLPFGAENLVSLEKNLLILPGNLLRILNIGPNGENIGLILARNLLNILNIGPNGENIGLILPGNLLNILMAEPFF